LHIVIIYDMRESEKESAGSRLRMTRQRQVILDEFRKANTHLTADEVYEKVRKRMPRVSLGTVYRNLEILSRRGFVDKIELAGHQKMFDGNMDKHYHLRCVRCSNIIDIPARNIRVDLKTVEEEGEFKVTGYRLEFTGLCPQCRRIAEKNP
jgi:Fur family ferric uptake transcriptional regulator